jgi:predicted protein tyrosine phosphatase
MKLEIYTKKTARSRFVQVQEAGLLADAATLRRLARFLVHCADGIERSPAAFGHMHLKDFERELGGMTPDISVGPL